MSQTFTFNYPRGSVGYYVNESGAVISRTTLTVNVDYEISTQGDTFAVGDEVYVNRFVNGNPAPLGDMTITGVTPTGMILSGSGGNIYLTTDHDEVYSVGDVIVFDSTPGAIFPVCFVRGTLIDTSRGPVAIEALEPGDQVVGSTGLRTVKWIGWRNYGPLALHTETQKTQSAPIRIRQHALADDQPSQDLLVSPWHHLYVDGVLVRANDLINGMTIIQDRHVTSVSYYHVELDQFDVVRAHGVYSESWADGGNRDFFQNVDVTQLRPEDKQRRLADRPGFTALRNRQEIRRIHARLAARAEELARDTDVSRAA